MVRIARLSKPGQKLLFLRMYHARCQRLETYWCESLLQELRRGMR
jgi:hypothetical protein